MKRIVTMVRACAARAIFLVALLLAGALSACTVSSEGAWLNAPGWGRAQLIGPSSIPDPASIALDSQGNMYTFAAVEDGERVLLRAARLDRDLNTVWEQALDVEPGRADQPQIAWDGEHLRLLWIDVDRLYAATLDTAGEVVRQPRLVSGEHTVSSFDVATHGRQVAVWFGGSAQAPGVFVVDMSAGEEAPLLVDEGGYRPLVRFDAGGNLHAAWLHFPPGVVDATLFYAHYAGGQVAADGGEAAMEVVTFTVGFTSGLEGPAFGVDDGHAYLLWSILVRTGPAAGSAATSYVSFPLGRPQEATTRQELYVPDNYDLIYDDAPAGAALQAGPRVALDAAGGGAAPQDMWTDVQAQNELVVAARASIAFELRKQASQSTLIFFRDGEAREYQLLSFSRSRTVAPYVRSDDEGYLYATWMEPGNESSYVTYLAGTAPGVHAALSEISLADVGRLVTETIFGLLAGAALSPFAGVLWLIAPLFVLGVTSFMRRDDERTISPGSALSLLLALIAFWAAKWATLPGIQEYVPFSSWIPFIPLWLGEPLRWAVQIVIAAAALYTAWRFTYRRRAPSALHFMLIYAAVDSVLSMAIYGSLIYGFI